MIPPFQLPTPTTISWPPLITTFLTIEGGHTGLSTVTKETLINGIITQTTTEVLTVDGGTIGTITSTVTYPPLTTDLLSFHPVVADPSHSGAFLGAAP